MDIKAHVLVNIVECTVDAMEWKNLKCYRFMLEDITKAEIVEWAFWFSVAIWEYERDYEMIKVD